MTRDQLERALREAEPPDAGPARERARRTVLAAHAEARSRRRPRRVAPLLYAALAALLAAFVFTQRDSGPAQAVQRLVDHIVSEPTPAPTRPPSCPPRAGCSSAARRPVRPQRHAQGRARPLRGRDLVAARAVRGGDRRAGARRAQPAQRRAALAPGPGGAVGFPRWAPDGLHIAYRAGGALRIVYGNGEHDVLAGRDMADVAPAWRPGVPRTVAWADAHGTVTVEDADTAKVLRTYRSGGVRQLAWSADGRKLLIAGRRHGTIRDYATGEHPARARRRPARPPPTAAAWRWPSNTATGPRSGCAEACSSAPRAASTTSMVAGRPLAARR